MVRRTLVPYARSEPHSPTAFRPNTSTKWGPHHSGCNTVSSTCSQNHQPARRHQEDEWASLGGALKIDLGSSIRLVRLPVAIFDRLNKTALSGSQGRLSLSSSSTAPLGGCATGKYAHEILDTSYTLVKTTVWLRRRLKAPSAELEGSS